MTRSVCKPGPEQTQPGEGLSLLLGSVTSECGLADVNRHVRMLHQFGPLRGRVKKCRGRSRCSVQQTTCTRCRGEHHLGNQRPMSGKSKGTGELLSHQRLASVATCVGGAGNATHATAPLGVPIAADVQGGFPPLCSRGSRTS